MMKEEEAEAEKSRCWMKEEGRSYWSNHLGTAVNPEQILLTEEWWTLAAPSGELSYTCVGSFRELLKGKFPN